MRSEETSAGNATLLSSLTSCSFFFVGRRRSFEECEKGESKWTERGASSPSASSMTTTARRPDAAIAACTSVSKSFFHTALCVMRLQRGSSERAAVSLLHSSLSSIFFIAVVKVTSCTPSPPPASPNAPAPVRLSVAVCREMEFMCDCGSQSQAAADKTSK